MAMKQESADGDRRWVNCSHDLAGAQAGRVFAGKHGPKKLFPIQQKAHNPYMRTNIELDDGLVSEGFAITGLKTKKDLVDFALRELVRQRERRKMLSMRGKFQWQGDLEKSRENRFPWPWWIRECGLIFLPGGTVRK